MNIERLRMVQVMLERMIAGSWVSVETLGDKEGTGYTKGLPKPVEIREFDLSSWRSVVATPDNTNVCGFTACVIGHACFDEQFRELGWSWDGSTPMFDGKSNWRAVNKFFGFSEVRDYGVGELLFTEDAYAARDVFGHWDRMLGDDRRHVINRVDELIMLGEAQFIKKHEKLLEYIENA